MIGEGLRLKVILGSIFAFLFDSPFPWSNEHGAWRVGELGEWTCINDVYLA